MFGAVIGDIIGSRFEFDNLKSKHFQLWHEHCFFTDDSVCTVAVADILMNGHTDIVRVMKEWCLRYPTMSYGSRFGEWLFSDTTYSYGSFGNGAAMRVSPAAYLHRRDLTAALHASDRVTEITHDHPDGLKGARAVTHAIWLALNGGTPDDIAKAISTEYGYDLSRTVDEIRPSYSFDETCPGTVPEALICALESDCYEDAIRNAVSIGGDSDTVAAIAGSVAEGLHGVQSSFVERACNEYLDARLAEVLHAMYSDG